MFRSIEIFCPRVSTTLFMVSLHTPIRHHHGPLYLVLSWKKEWILFCSCYTYSLSFYSLSSISIQSTTWKTSWPNWSHPCTMPLFTSATVTCSYTCSGRFTLHLLLLYLRDVSLTCILPVPTNAVMYLKSAISANLPAYLIIVVLLSLDEILLQSETILANLHVIQFLFPIWKYFALKLHRTKCITVARAILWRGHLIPLNGRRFDPWLTHPFQNIEFPIKMYQMQQCFCSLKCMRSAIPTSSALFPPLSNLF